MDRMTEHEKHSKFICIDHICSRVLHINKIWKLLSYAIHDHVKCCFFVYWIVLRKSTLFFFYLWKCRALWSYSYFMHSTTKQLCFVRNLELMPFVLETLCVCFVLLNNFSFKCDFKISECIFKYYRSIVARVETKQ